jgi:hypothetical protein
MRRIVYAFVFAFMAAELIVAGAGACEATNDTCTINPGDTIYVDLPVIEEGMLFRMEIKDAVARCEDGCFEISAENFTMPCTMANMTIQLQANESSTIGLQCTRDGGVRDLSMTGNEVQVCSFDCPGGCAESMKFYGTCCSSHSEVRINLTMEGTLDQVTETCPDEFSFELHGISDGVTNVSVELDGTELIQEVTVTSEPTGANECHLTLA